MTDDQADTPIVPGGHRSWARSGAAAATGRAVLDGRVLDPAALAAEAAVAGPARLDDLASRLRGHFAMVVRDGDALVVATDSVGSIPVYVDRRGTMASDDARAIATPPPRLAAIETAELLHAAFVSGVDTVWPDVVRAPGGSVTRIGPAGVERSRWHRFRPDAAEGPSAEDLIADLDAAMTTAVERCLSLVGDRPLVLPLSAGVDSRVIAAVLARLGTKPALAYTYGRPGSTEVASGRAVAERFGFPWIGVEHSTEGWAALRGGQWSPELAFHIGGIASAPNPHDLLALLRLTERGALPEHAVMMPGHTGDVISGSQTPASLRRSGPCTADDVRAAVWKEHYRRRRMSGLARIVGCSAAEVEHGLRARLARALGALPDEMSAAEAIGHADQFNVDERQSKFTVHSVRVYEALGHDFVLPWWDPDVVAVLERTPLPLRAGTRLRNMYASQLTGEVRGEPASARAERKAMELVQRTGLDTIAKLAKRRARRLSRRRSYEGSPTGWFGLIDREHFLASFTGREDAVTYLAEAGLDYLVEPRRSTV